MVKSNNICQLADLPGGIDVSDTANLFEKSEERNQTTKFYLKSRESRLGFKERGKQLTDVQGHCEKSQLVKTREYEANETEFEKYNR